MLLQTGAHFGELGASLKYTLVHQENKSVLCIAGDRQYRTEVTSTTVLTGDAYTRQYSKTTLTGFTQNRNS